MLLNSAYPIPWSPGVLMALKSHWSSATLSLLGGRFNNSIRLWWVCCLSPPYYQQGRQDPYLQSRWNSTNHPSSYQNFWEPNRKNGWPSQLKHYYYTTQSSNKLNFEGMAKITDGTITHLTNKTRSIDKLDWYRCSWYMCVLISWWQSAWKCVSSALSVIIERGFQRVNHSRPFAILFWEYACAFQQIHWSFPVLLSFRTCTIAPQYTCQSKTPGS